MREARRYGVFRGRIAAILPFFLSPLTPLLPLFPPGKGPVVCLTRSRQDVKDFQEADRPPSPLLSLAPRPFSLLSPLAPFPPLRAFA